jgi:putative ABC transport system substrate-binding protein
MLLVRALIVTLGILAAPLAAAAQQPAGKVPRIGYLAPSSPSDATPGFVGAFRQGLRDLGYVEGKNIVIEYRSAEGKQERLPDLAAELVRLKVDIIVATTTSVALATKNATRTIPIVGVLVADPVGMGLVASLARPGGNITGTSAFGIEIGAKQLELLKETVPRISRVAVLYNPAGGYSGPLLRELEGAARTLGVQLQLLEIRSPNELDRAFSAMTKERAGALFVPGDAMLLVHRTQIAELAARSRLPALYGLRQHVEAGGLMSYSANFSDLFRRAATYVDKILKGTKPADLPVEQPTRFELIINLKTAKALGISIPPSVLIRADKVIE